MPKLKIEIQTLVEVQPDAPVGIAVKSEGTVFTRLERRGVTDDYFQGPPGQLAFWFVDNWWRLRYECFPASGLTADWRLAHDFSDIGGGYAWPRLAFWGEGCRVGLLSQSDPLGVVGPVRYLTDALIYIPAECFEREVDSFLDRVASERQGLTSDWQVLRSLVNRLIAERCDSDFAAWRRLEAQLGYDVDEVPEGLMASLAAFQEEYGAGAIAEAALANPGIEAAAVLQAEIDAAKSHHVQCDLRRTAALVGRIDGQPGDPPWRLGEIAAADVLQAVGHQGGPLSNSALADILRVRRSALDKVPPRGPRNPAYGLRLDQGGRRGEIVALSSRWAQARRFEFCRALGDAIWSGGERLGPLTKTKSERQKFQRAFAQSLLCPFEALVNFIGDDRSDGALAAAARHFSVSERMVRSVLVNKRQVDRERLVNFEQSAVAQGFEASGGGFDEIVEAA